MKIAHALQMSALQQGGVEVLVRSLIELAAPTVKVYLVSQDATQSILASELAGSIAGHLPVPTGTLPLSWNNELLAWVAENRIDLVHFHLSGTYGWKARSWHHCPITRLAKAGTVVVCTNHQAVTFFDAGRPPCPLWRKLAGTVRYWPGKTRQLHAARWEACVSKHDHALSLRSFPGSNHKLIQLYHSRLNANLPVNEGARSLSILNVATVAYRKGQHVLAEAFSRIAPDFPEWTLDLVGYKAEGECVETIENIRRKHHLEGRIRLHGPHPDPTKFYHRAAIYAQPSLLEGLGLSLQEAMFHGISCVGSDCGGIPELIADPSLGLLFRCGDASALAEVLSRLIRDPELRERTGSAARQSILARGMTCEAMYATYRELYSEAIHTL